LVVVGVKFYSTQQIIGPLELGVRFLEFDSFKRSGETKCGGLGLDLGLNSRNLMQSANSFEVDLEAR
jgi:hypothetical protein